MPIASPDVAVMAAPVSERTTGEPAGCRRSGGASADHGDAPGEVVWNVGSCWLVIRATKRTASSTRSLMARS